MKAVSDALAYVNAATGAAVIALHHTTKTTWRPGGPPPNLADARGHGALVGRIDTEIALVPCEAASGEVAFDAWVVKQRDEEKAAPRRYRIDMTGPAAVVSEEEIDLAA